MIITKHNYDREKGSTYMFARKGSEERGGTEDNKLSSPVCIRFTILRSSCRWSSQPEIPHKPSVEYIHNI